VVPVAGVLVFNAGADASGGELLHRVDLRHALLMLHRRKAVVIAEHPSGRMIGEWPMPLSVALVHWVYAKWMHGRTRTWSKRGVLTRDNDTCGYCSAHADTVDHIKPVSKGGRSTWLNTVAACGRCNQRKSDMTLTEAHRRYGMRLQIEPYEPSPAGWVLAAAR
jgi:5-methylcytosine-specific restriction endonuclease McrA